MVPRSDGIQLDKRPLDILASDLVVSIELKPGSTVTDHPSVQVARLTKTGTVCCQYRYHGPHG